MSTPQPPAHRHRQAGFSLLEAIVTLVIVSLLVTILMQALNQAMQLRTRLLRFDRENRVMVLQEMWFRETVAGMQRPDAEDQDSIVLGTHDALAYTTPSPLVAQGFSQVRWWLANGQLHYADSQVADVVIIDGLQAGAAFSYLDNQQTWHPNWVWKEHGHMPKMLRLTAQTARGDIHWMVPLMADGLDPAKLKLDDVGSHGI